MKNAFSGYTYQHQVTLLLIALMDVERNIQHLEIEAKTDDNFDDLVLTTNSEKFQLQIKDFKKCNIDDLTISNDAIIINGKSHKLSNNQNVIFLKEVNLTPNDNFLIFPCCRINGNVSVVSLSRTDIDNALKKLYKTNSSRQNEIDCFFNKILDERIWKIPIETLPQIKIFITALQEKSIEISHKLLDFDNLLLIEGKPGVGKSHFVNTLTKSYTNYILYRFWIGNQDKDYHERLKFGNFIRDLNAKIFQDQQERSEKELLSKIKSENKTIIIDGLDHVENYNSIELKLFIDFIEKAGQCCKTIVLSRPLALKLTWQTHILDNWSLGQTKNVLSELFHMTQYIVVDRIYNISKGYPIIVKFLAEHYKLHKSIPEIDTIDTIDYYYENIITNTKIKQCLTLFLCCNSFIMRSEIGSFIGNEKVYVEEFIETYPYLFDIKLNRISLVHDSFNTYLRKHLNYEQQLDKVSVFVTNSILDLDIRFLSRYSFFYLSKEQRKKIIKKYCSLSVYEKVIKNCIDPEAISSFYNQLRESLCEISPKELSLSHYYDFSLILNLTIRDHLSTNNTFYYTYTEILIKHGITEEDITSSDFLFAMFYFVKTKNTSILLNRTSKDHYDVLNFHSRLEADVLREQRYIAKHDRKLDKKTIEKALKNQIKLKENLTYIIENIYINGSKIKGFEILLDIIDGYVKDNRHEAEYKLSQFLNTIGAPQNYSNWILYDVYKNLLSYGCKIECKNEYLDLTLKQLILKYREQGSFNLLSEIHNYIRLALLQDREIDINSISIFWPKYYNRKDYTLLGVPIALKTLENRNLISLYQCIELIQQIRSISEKGYRGLLADFVELYPAATIISFLERNFDTNKLNIEWLKLPVKYIDAISDRTFMDELYEQINYHRHSSFIPFYEIKTALASKRLNEIERKFNQFNITVNYKSEEKKAIDKFNHSSIIFKEEKEQYSSGYKNTALQRFKEGILDYNDVKFINRQQLKPSEVTKFSDGNYTTLPSIDVFGIYSLEEVRQNLNAILYNSLIGKTNSIKSFHSIYYHPGNVLALIDKYGDKTLFKKSTKSFLKFINLSLFEMKLNKKTSL